MKTEKINNNNMKILNISKFKWVSLVIYLELFWIIYLGLLRIIIKSGAAQTQTQSGLTCLCLHVKPINLPIVCMAVIIYFNHTQTVWYIHTYYIIWSACGAAAYEQRQYRRPTDSYISKLIKVATSVEFSRWMMRNK